MSFLWLNIRRPVQVPSTFRSEQYRKRLELPRRLLRAALTLTGHEVTVIDVLNIQEKRKPAPLRPAAADDFACEKIGEAEPGVVLTDPTISLYCLDHPARRVLFVQVPGSVDVTSPPFLYLAQYEHAVRVLAMPYEIFHSLAAGIEPGAPLVFIHSTGRAGSTLLSKAFAEMASVTSLSEPDVYTQATVLRLGGSDPGEIQELLTSATKILFNPAFTRGSSLHVVKFRSFAIEVGDLLHRAFPGAGNLFLYRDLAATIQSAVRAFNIDERTSEATRQVVSSLASMTPLLAEEAARRNDLAGIEAPSLIWLSTVRAYSRLYREGVPILAVRYEDLVSDPRRILGNILAYLNFPIDGVESGLRAFEYDSQAGSPLSREEAASHAVRTDSLRWDLVRDLVERYPITGTDIPPASVVLP